MHVCANTHTCAHTYNKITDSLKRSRYVTSSASFQTVNRERGEQKVVDCQFSPAWNHLLHRAHHTIQPGYKKSPLPRAGQPSKSLVPSQRDSSSCHGQRNSPGSSSKGPSGSPELADTHITYTMSIHTYIHKPLHKEEQECARTCVPMSARRVGQGRGSNEQVNDDPGRRRAAASSRADRGNGCGRRERGARAKCTKRTMATICAYRNSCKARGAVFCHQSCRRQSLSQGRGSTREELVSNTNDLKNRQRPASLLQYWHPETASLAFFQRGGL